MIEFSWITRISSTIESALISCAVISGSERSCSFAFVALTDIVSPSARRNAALRVEPRPPYAAPSLCFRFPKILSLSRQRPHFLTRARCLARWRSRYELADRILQAGSDDKILRFILRQRQPMYVDVGLGPWHGRGAQGFDVALRHTFSPCAIVISRLARVCTDAMDAPDVAPSI